VAWTHAVSQAGPGPLQLLLPLLLTPQAAPPPALGAKLAVVPNALFSVEWTRLFAGWTIFGARRQISKPRSETGH
jgi:hypothetical protein